MNQYIYDYHTRTLILYTQSIQQQCQHLQFQIPKLPKYSPSSYAIYEQIFLCIKWYDKHFIQPIVWPTLFTLTTPIIRPIPQRSELKNIPKFTQLHSSSCTRTKSMKSQTLSSLCTDKKLASLHVTNAPIHSCSFISKFDFCL